MKLETARLTSLHPAPHNARIHPEAQITELMRAVEMFGQTRPLVVDEENTVLVGNGLLTALQRLGHRSAQVLRMPGMTESNKAKLMLSDNKIFDLGINDYDAIVAVMHELDDLDVPGFDADTMATLLASDAVTSSAAAAFEQANLRTARPTRVGGETRVTCPHCGKEFVLTRRSAA